MENRNLWSKSELITLTKLVNQHGPGKGSNLASSLLGRSKRSCEQKWYLTKRKNKTITTKHNTETVPLIKEKETKITYHNGVSHKARIIAKTDSIIVAKCNDIVITIETTN